MRVGSSSHEEAEHSDGNELTVTSEVLDSAGSGPAS